MRLMLGQLADLQRRVQGPLGERADGGQPLATALAADAYQAGRQVEIVVDQAYQFADPQAGRIHRLQDRAVPPAHDGLPRGSHQQAADFIGGEEMG